MKKYVLVFISIMLIFSLLCGCGAQNNGNGSSNSQNSFNYDIHIVNDLPDTLDYSYGKYYVKSTCKVTDVHFEVHGDELCAFVYGEKTFDMDGDYGDNPVKFKCILKDSSQNIVAYYTAAVYSRVPGMKLGDDGYVGFKLVDISKLTEGGTYYFEMVDEK